MSQPDTSVEELAAGRCAAVRLYRLCGLHESVGTRVANVENSHGDNIGGLSIGFSMVHAGGAFLRHEI